MKIASGLEVSENTLFHKRDAEIKRLHHIWDDATFLTTDKEEASVKTQLAEKYRDIQTAREDFLKEKVKKERKVARRKRREKVQQLTNPFLELFWKKIME